MLKFMVLLIATIQVVTSSGDTSLDYANQAGWGGDCNKQGSRKQSPVDVITPEACTMEKGKLIELSVEADKTDAENMNDLNSIKITFKNVITYKIPGLENTIGKVEQFHLHWGQNDSVGSEHLLNGKRFSAEAHLVTSYGEDGKLAVVARFFKVGKENDQIKKMLDSQSEYEYDSNDDKKISSFNLKALYPSDILQVITYSGSLTTPDCSEIVHWVVVPERLTVSTEQLNKLRAVSLGVGHRKTFNWRDTQDLNGRSFTSYKSSSCKLFASSLLLILTIITH
ncbi:carbonic anhydrase 1-like [Bolinopsis microptera]|uniref:carbonic anhydrase 1-like n=1 Tax=Bolinopsis microptera TaxID=2820187 RepID=UPI00307A2E35